MSAKDGKPCKKCGNTDWYKSGHCKRCMGDNSRARQKLKPSCDDGETIDKGLEVRFWKKVKKGPSCWEWTGSRDRKGYGRIAATLAVRNLKAHRISYQLHVGPIPPGLSVLHKCDNPGCVRPDHLFLGTNADNMQDMISKGRGGLGERNPGARLTAADIEDIRKSRSRGESFRSIAARLHVSPSCVHKVATKKTWTHVTSE